MMIKNATTAHVEKGATENSRKEKIFAPASALKKKKKHFLPFSEQESYRSDRDPTDFGVSAKSGYRSEDYQKRRGLIEICSNLVSFLVYFFFFTFSSVL
jgi:hypothetical protein